ncbi:MAG: hypothetical protein Q8S73_11630 [Deltaproteobacteria bacterium]|nr:hypothetical protein [Myxococcales bacterium]MDP3214748.1 hypothetical protein [Deltaproteobacteria bacterium]
MADEAPEPARDEYTAQYMEGGRARIVTKQRMPGWFFGLMALAALAVLGSGLAGGSIASLVGLIPLAFATLLLSHLRVVVTDDAVHVQYGLWGPTIAVESITRCEVKPYEALRFGGWGFKRSLDGTMAYSVPGGEGECVALEIADGAKTRKVVITTPNAAAVALAIEEARARKLGSGVRIDAATAVTDAEEPAETGAASAGRQRR